MFHLLWHVDMLFRVSSVSIKLKRLWYFCVQDEVRGDEIDCYQQNNQYEGVEEIFFFLQPPPLSL